MMINSIITNFTSAIGADYIVLIFGIFLVFMVVCLILDNFK